MKIPNIPFGNFSRTESKMSGMGGVIAAKSFAKKLRRRSIHGQEKSSQERKIETQYLCLQTPFTLLPVVSRFWIVECTADIGIGSRTLPITASLIAISISSGF